VLVALVGEVFCGSEGETRRNDALNRRVVRKVQEQHCVTSTYVSIRQHSSAYVSIRWVVRKVQRQHCYVSARQHMSGYIGCRQLHAAVIIYIYIYIYIIYTYIHIYIAAVSVYI